MLGPLSFFKFGKPRRSKWRPQHLPGANYLLVLRALKRTKCFFWSRRKVQPGGKGNCRTGLVQQSFHKIGDLKSIINSSFIPGFIVSNSLWLTKIFLPLRY